MADGGATGKIGDIERWRFLRGEDWVRWEGGVSRVGGLEKLEGVGVLMVLL